MTMDLDWQPADETQGLRPHLPECALRDTRNAPGCICTELRACEARTVRELALGAVTDANRSYDTGYSAALDAAASVSLPHLAALIRHGCTADNWEQTDALIRRSVLGIKADINSLRTKRQVSTSGCLDDVGR